MSYDDGNKKENVIIAQTADFKAAYAKYQEQVQSIHNQIEASQKELAQVMGSLAQAKAALMEQYSKKVTDMGSQIDVLQAQVDDLTVKIRALDIQIQDRQQTKDAINLDFTNQRVLIDTANADIKNKMDELSNMQKKFDSDAIVLSARQSDLEEAKKEFDSYRVKELTDVLTKIKEAQDKTESANALITSAQANLKEARDAQLAINQAQSDLEAKTIVAQAVIDQAAAIKKKSDDADVQEQENSKLALQNQQDMNAIKVAKIAVSNREQSVAAREAAVAQAEIKIIGG